MSWFGGFFTGVSMSINAAFCLVIDKLTNERDDLKKKLAESNKCHDGGEYRHGYRHGYQVGQKENIQDIFNTIINRLHIEEGVEDTKKYMATVLNDLTKEQLEVVTLLVAQALKETPERTSKNTITLDLDDAINNGPAKLISEFEALSIDDNPLNIDVNVLVGESKLMDMNVTFNFSEDPETFNKFNKLLEDFVNSDAEELVNRWTEGFANRWTEEVPANEPTDTIASDGNDKPVEMM